MTKKTKKESKEVNTVQVIPDNTAHAAQLIEGVNYKTKYLNGIAKTGKALRNMVQNAAFMALLQVFGSNQTNYDYLNQLLNTIQGNMSESDMKKLVLWVQEYSPTRFVKTKNGHSFRKEKDTDKEFNFQGAIDNPWHTMELLTPDEVKELTSASITKRIEGMIKDIEKTLSGENPRKVVPSNDKENVKSQLASLEGLRDSITGMITTPSNDDNTTELSEVA